MSFGRTGTVVFSISLRLHLRIVDAIRNKQMLELMKRLDGKGQPISFSIRAVTCDLNRGTGGQIITWENVQLARNVTALSIAQKKEFIPTHRKRLPEDWKSGIIKLFIPTSGQVVSVRHRLITEFKLFTDPTWREVRL